MLKLDIGSTKSKHSLFTYYYKDIFDYSEGRICKSFQFTNINFCVFHIKKFEKRGNHLTLTKIVNLSHRETHHLYKNRYYSANNC